MLKIDEAKATQTANRTAEAQLVQLHSVINRACVEYAKAMDDCFGVDVQAYVDLPAINAILAAGLADMRKELAVKPKQEVP